MTLTNGQDRSAAYQREQKRLSIEGVQKQPVSIIAPPIKAGPSVLRPKEVADFVREIARRGRAIEHAFISLDLRTHLSPVGLSSKSSASVPVASRNKASGLVEGYRKICERWMLDDAAIATLLHLEDETALCHLILTGRIPPITGDLKDRMALIIGISLGLGELFDDNLDAELTWLNTSRVELNNDSPLEHMRSGSFASIRDVDDLLLIERGLR